MTIKASVTGSVLAMLVCLVQSAYSVPLDLKPDLSQTTITGKVFYDHNGNGVQDLGDEGVAGIRLVTVTGLQVDTDGYGRFHLVKRSKQQPFFTDNIILKLDKASLPSGSQLTTENPRVLRKGFVGLNKVNFGVRF